MSNKKSSTIKALVVEPGKAPYAADIPNVRELPRIFEYSERQIRRILVENKF